jgi:serine/threonine protein kinase
MPRTRGAVHRDVKRANVPLDGERAVQADFGRAKLLRSDTKVTETGIVVGTFDSIAPGRCS